MGAGTEPDQGGGTEKPTAKVPGTGAKDPNWRQHLRPPWRKGETGNPGGSSKRQRLQRLARKVTEKQFRAVLRGAIIDPIVEAAVTKEASKHAGMTPFQQMSILLAAAKARSEFANQHEWLLFVKAAAGHVDDEAPAIDSVGPVALDPARGAGDAAGGTTGGSLSDEPKEPTP